MSAADEIRAIFAGTPLSEVDIEDRAIGSTEEVGVHFELAGIDPLVAWEVAREAVPLTGRWPVLVDDLENLWAGAFERPHEQAPVEITRRAADIPWPDTPAERVTDDEFWDRIVNGELTVTRLRNGHAPERNEILDAVHERSRVELDAALTAWEDRDRPTVGREIRGPDEPSFSLSEAFGLALLPHPEPWFVPAYIPFWGAADYGKSDRLVRALRSWHKRFAAAPCATTTVTLDLRIDRPPTNLAVARQFIIEQLEFVKQDNSIREVARMLLGQSSWELFDRP